MNNSEETLSQQESLQIIQQMIQSAKQEQKDDGMGWIIWGWLLFAASVLTVLNFYVKWVNTYFFWNIFGLLTVALLIVKVIKSKTGKSSRRVQTYTQEIFQKLNLGFTVTLLIIIVAINVSVSPKAGFALLISLYGFWMLIYGALFNFKPSLIGAGCAWMCALAALFVPTFQWVMLLHAIAVLLGYLVPGYMANKEFKKIQAGNILKVL